VKGLGECEVHRDPSFFLVFIQCVGNSGAVIEARQIFWTVSPLSQGMGVW